MITNKICAKDFDNKRPIIAILIINNKLQFKKKENLYQYYLQIIHYMLHILGFNKEKLYQSKILRRKAINSGSLRNINEKITNNWYSKVYFQFPKSNYKSLRLDIMSKKKSRMPMFSYLTLAILQSMNWYQINLSSCGCSLNGDCDYFKYPISISFSQNLNGDVRLYCFLNTKSKCSTIKDSFIPKTIFNKINKTEYTEYFNKKHCRNKFLTWKSSSPNIKMPQIINLLSPKKNGKCKNQQRTIFLYYPNYLNETYPELENYKIEQYKINSKDLIVYHTYIYNEDAMPFFKLAKYNKIPYHKNYFLSNIVAQMFNRKKLPDIVGSLGKYQVYSYGIYSYGAYSNKAQLYRNFRKLKSKFQNDFKFLPETYLLPEDKEIILEKFNNYTFKENDLWIYKPPKGSLGIGIKLLKKKEDFLKSSFISKYISNPLLLYKRKFHIRMYVVVTGFLPLKIYIFNEGQVMQASSDYIYDIKKMHKKTSMLTNVFQNGKKPGYKKNITLDTQDGSEWKLKL